MKLQNYIFESPKPIPLAKLTAILNCNFGCLCAGFNWDSCVWKDSTGEPGDCLLTKDENGDVWKSLVRQCFDLWEDVSVYKRIIQLLDGDGTRVNRVTEEALNQLGFTGSIYARKYAEECRVHPPNVPDFFRHLKVGAPAHLPASTTIIRDQQGMYTYNVPHNANVAYYLGDALDDQARGFNEEYIGRMFEENDVTVLVPPLPPAIQIAEYDYIPPRQETTFHPGLHNSSATFNPAGQIFIHTREETPPEVSTE